jgi:PKD repeat protein
MTLSTALNAGLILCAMILCISGVQAAITVNAGMDQTVSVGHQVKVNAVYNDTAATTVENRSAVINWTRTEAAGTIVADDGFNGSVTGTYTFSVPGTYTVAVNVSNTNESTWAVDTLIVTVKGMTMETKIVPKTLNRKSNGVMTVFLSPGDWWNEADLGTLTRNALNRDMVIFMGAMPMRINFCQKEGGTFILKFRRQDLNIDENDGEQKITGNLTMKDGDMAFESTGSVRIKNADTAGKENGKKNPYDEEESDNEDHAREKGVKTSNGHGKK